MSGYLQPNLDLLYGFQEQENTFSYPEMDGVHVQAFGTAHEFEIHDIDPFQLSQGTANEQYLQYLSTSWYPSWLADDNRARGPLWTEKFEDKELNYRDSKDFEELSRTTPVVTKSLEEFQRVAGDLPRATVSHNINRGHKGKQAEPSYNTRIERGITEANSPFTSSSRAPPCTPQPRRQPRFSCLYCGSKHDRMARARDCRYIDLGLRPYVCMGRCGDSLCPATYGSEERWRRHLSPSVQCPRCDKQITRQNVARHSTIYCPNRER